MDNHTSTSRAEAERLLGVAEKLLRNKDLTGSREFAILAQETEPLLEGSDQIVAIIEVLLAAEKRVNNHPDWYSVLQIAPKSNDSELIKKQYRRLALLLHPDKNKFAFAESAFHLVADAWGVLSDPGKKSGFDSELGGNFSRVDLEESRKRKEKESQSTQDHSSAGPVRQSTPATPASGGVFSYSSQTRKRGRPKGSLGKAKVSSNGVRGATAGGGATPPPPPPRSANFWTACPYCYNLYEYPKMYEGCCLRCLKCKKAFTGEGIRYEPPTVPGKEEYYCCWGMFPMGFSNASQAGRGRRDGAAKGFENWMPVMQNVSKANMGIGGRNLNFKATPKPKAMPVPVAVPVATASVNAAASVSPVPVAAASANAAAAAPVSATPVSSSAPKKRGRGRPRKNPLP